MTPQLARLLLGGLAVAAPGVGLAATSVPAPLQPAAALDDGRAGSAALTRLFARTCLRHAGDARALRSALAGRQYRPAPDAPGLLARPGQAFQVSGEAGHLMVLSFDDGWCGDGGTGIDPHALTLQLAASMRDAGIGMRLMGADGDGREQRYLLTRPAPARPVVLLVLLLPADPFEPGTLMQASLFAAPMPPEPDQSR